MFRLIAESVTSSLRTGKDDITNFYETDISNFVGDQRFWGINEICDTWLHHNWQTDFNLHIHLGLLSFRSYTTVQRKDKMVSLYTCHPHSIVMKICTLVT